MSKTAVSSPPSTTEKKAKFSEKSLADAKILEKAQRHTPLIDEDGYETIEASKNKKSRRNTEKEDQGQTIDSSKGSVRRINNWSAKIIRPEAINEEWKQILEQGEMDLPRNFFDERMVGSSKI